MEQTEYTTWEVVKMLRMLPFEELNSRFVQTLVKVIDSVPIKELKECETIRARHRHARIDSRLER